MVLLLREGPKLRNRSSELLIEIPVNFDTVDPSLGSIDCSKLGLCLIDLSPRPEVKIPGPTDFLGGLPTFSLAEGGIGKWLFRLDFEAVATNVADDSEATVVPATFVA